MSGTTITITYQADPDIGFYSYDVALGQFPTGNYTVQILSPGGPVTAQFVVGPAPRSQRHPGTVPAVNYSAMWWSPLESGWGLSISQGPTNELFAVWFVYDAAGMPTWYTLESGMWTATAFRTIYSGVIRRYTGPYFASAFDPGKVAGTTVGAGTLTFTDANNGRFDWTIADRSGFKTIARLPLE